MTAFLLIGKEHWSYTPANTNSLIKEQLIELFFCLEHVRLE